MSTSRSRGLLILAALVVNVNYPKAISAADKAKRTVRNLPDIDVTETGLWSIDQETNFFSSSGISNLSIDYGISSGWDFGLSLLNAQFYATSDGGISFQPDVLASLERHWQWDGDHQIILGSQAGAVVMPDVTSFLNFSYLEYQQKFTDWDFAIGGYYANAAFAGVDSIGFHLYLELPLIERLRVNGDYLSGKNGLGGTTVKMLYPVFNDWQIGLGVQFPTIYAGDHYVGLMGIYWH
jgi:hypothetical protein